MDTPTSDEESGFESFVRRLWHGGLVRSVRVTREGRTLVDVPLTVIVIGGLLAPWLLVGAGVAVLTGCQIVLHQMEPPAAEKPTSEDERQAKAPQPNKIPNPSPRRRRPSRAAERCRPTCPVL